MKLLMLGAMIGVACGRAEPEQASRSTRPTPRPAANGAPVPAAPVPATSPTLTKTEQGRWRSDDGKLCFELFKNGDFQLSFPLERQKVQVLGHHEVVATRGGLDDQFLLKVERIWFSRYIGNCRKTVVDGHWADSYEVVQLGAKLEKGKNIAVTFKMSDDDHMEMCASTCVRMSREVPSLYGRWRVGALDHDTRGVVWNADEVLDVQLGKEDHATSWVWMGNGTKTFARLQGDATVRVVESDRDHDVFEIVLTANGTPHTFAATRLIGERLRICNGEHCSDLDRMFRDNDPE